MRIFYFSPDHNAPSGGIKVIYNHATILRENGFEAFILHSKKGFKSTWFENKCPLKYLSEISFLPTDIVVIPEIFFHLAANPELNLKDRIRNFRGKKTDYYGAKFIWQSVAKKIVFNQNAYHTFLDFSTKYPLNYHLFDIPQSYLCISDQNKYYLDSALAGKIIQRVQWSINKNIFNFGFAKKKQICYMTRKNSDHVMQVLSVLKIRNRLNGFELVAIENKNESQVAQIMKESTFYLSFGYPEGLPLPPAEAMACGCVVIGYNGGGGEEYFDPAYCLPVPFGNIIEFVEKVEEACLDIQKNEEKYLQMSKRASETIHSRYSAQNEKEILLNTWKKILSS